MASPDKKKQYYYKTVHKGRAVIKNGKLVWLVVPTHLTDAKPGDPLPDHYPISGPIDPDTDLPATPSR